MTQSYLNECLLVLVALIDVYTIWFLDLQRVLIVISAAAGQIKLKIKNSRKGKERKAKTQDTQGKYALGSVL